MNIFVLSECPVESAQMQCNKHIPKMVVESAQMLSTAHRMIDGEMERRPSKTGSMIQYFKLHDEREDSLYKACHFNHPSSVWVRESNTNYTWLYDHFVALCDEYTHRYGKIHMSDTKLRKALSEVPQNIPDRDLTAFKLAMGSNPECMLPDPVESYRRYYMTKQGRFKMVWTNRDIPTWFRKENP